MTTKPQSTTEEWEPITRSRQWLDDYEAGRLTASDLFTRCLLVDLLKIVDKLEERIAALSKKSPPLSATPVVDNQWFELALRYMRGDPTLTDLPFAEGTVFADFLLFWDAQTPHFRSVIKSVFQAAPYFTAAATAAPVEQRRSADDIVVEFIQNFTKIPLDGEAHRELVRIIESERFSK